MKYAVDRRGPLGVGLARVALGAVGLLGLGGPARIAPPSALRRLAPTLALLSVPVGCGQTLALTCGIARTPAATAGLIPPISPIWTIVLAAWVPGERMGVLGVPRG